MASDRHWNQWSGHCPSKAQISPAAEDMEMGQNYDWVLQLKEQDCAGH